MMEMYELCMFFKNYKEAEAKLLEFQKSFETVSWNPTALCHWSEIGSSGLLPASSQAMTAGE